MYVEMSWSMLAKNELEIIGQRKNTAMIIVTNEKKFEKKSSSMFNNRSAETYMYAKDEHRKTIAKSDRSGSSNNNPSIFLFSRQFFNVNVRIEQDH